MAMCATSPTIVNVTWSDIARDVTSPGEESDLLVVALAPVAMDFGRITVDRSPVLYRCGTPGQDRFRSMCDHLAIGALRCVVLTLLDVGLQRAMARAGR